MIRLGFNEELPFEIKMAESQYSNTEGIETEIQLADSGYGQGQLLVNPLHMACIYSAFCNEGNVIKPYLVYQNEAEAEYWIPGAFSNETASRVLEGTKKVVNNPNGTGYAAHRDDIILAGKTGTAEIKESKEGGYIRYGIRMVCYLHSRERYRMSYIDYQYGRRCERKRRKRICC